MVSSRPMTPEPKCSPGRQKQMKLRLLHLLIGRFAVGFRQFGEKSACRWIRWQPPRPSTKYESCHQGLGNRPWPAPGWTRRFRLNGRSQLILRKVRAPPGPAKSITNELLRGINAIMTAKLDGYRKVSKSIRQRPPSKLVSALRRKACPPAQLIEPEVLARRVATAGVGIGLG